MALLSVLLHHVGVECLFVFSTISSNKFHNGNVSTEEEAEEPHHTDDQVLDGSQWGQTLCVKG